MDPQFYAHDSETLAINGRVPLSKSVTRVFTDERLEKQFLEEIRKQCRISEYGLIFRTYSKDNAKDVRLIENWQHKYVPFLEYTGELKQDVLRLIWKVTGTDQLKL